MGRRLVDRIGPRPNYKQLCWQHDHTDQVLIMILSFQQAIYTHSSGCTRIIGSHCCWVVFILPGVPLSQDIMAEPGAGTWQHREAPLSHQLPPLPIPPSNVPHTNSHSRNLLICPSSSSSSSFSSRNYKWLILTRLNDRQGRETPFCSYYINSEEIHSVSDDAVKKLGAKVYTDLNIGLLLHP